MIKKFWNWKRNWKKAIIKKRVEGFNFHAKNNKSNHTGCGIRHTISAGYQESAQRDAAGGGQAYHSVYRGGGCGKRHRGYFNRHWPV